MKDQRNDDVHAVPVRPDNDVSVNLSGELQMSGAVGTAHIDVTKEAIATRDAVGEAAPSRSAQKPSSTYTYYFAAHRADGDVISLSRKYVARLRQMISDGRKNRFLSA